MQKGRDSFISVERRKHTAVLFRTHTRVHKALDGIMIHSEDRLRTNAMRLK
jgi:hypothetical protein